MRHLAVFASGSGTNAENIARNFRSSKKISVSLFLTDNSSARVIERGKNLGIETHVFSINELNEGVVTSLLKEKKIDFIVLAGFLKLIPENMLVAFPNRIINIHPALLPKFGGKGMYGMRVHRAVIEAKELESGITIHIVNKNYDEGDIIFQCKCPVIQCDQPETLAERIHELEYEHFPRVIEKFVNDSSL